MSEGKLAWQIDPTQPAPALSTPAPSAHPAHLLYSVTRSLVAFSVSFLCLIHSLPQAMEGGGNAGPVLGCGGARGAAIRASPPDPVPAVTLTSLVLRPSTASSCTASLWPGMARAHIYTHFMALASCLRALQGEGVASFSWQYCIGLRPRVGMALLSISAALCTFLWWPSLSSHLPWETGRRRSAPKCRAEELGHQRWGLLGSRPESGSARTGRGALGPQVGFSRTFLFARQTISVGSRALMPPLR